MRKLLFFLSLLLLTNFVHAQELKYKAAFTLNFIRYIGWNDEQTKGDFVIGIVGKEPLAAILKEQSVGRKFGYQDIVIKEFQASDKITPCQVLFIGKGASFEKNSDKIIKNGGGKGFLLITETPEGINSGSIINFVLEGDVIKFEISEANAKKLNITYNSKLTTMSSAIKR